MRTRNVSCHQRIPRRSTHVPRRLLLQSVLLYNIYIKLLIRTVSARRFLILRQQAQRINLSVAVSHLKTYKASTSNSSNVTLYNRNRTITSSATRLHDISRRNVAKYRSSTHYKIRLLSAPHRVNCTKHYTATAKLRRSVLPKSHQRLLISRELVILVNRRPRITLKRSTKRSIRNRLRRATPHTRSVSRLLEVL